jgi:two-component system nitrate/nitrite sensor histidine kinase NarX
MRKPLTLAAKLGLIGTALLLLGLASIGLTLWMTWQLEGGAAAVNEAGRMRMQTWRLAQAMGAPDLQRRDALMAGFEQSLELLRRGDPARPLFMPQDPRSTARFAEVQRDWLALRQTWRDERQPSAAEAARDADAFVQRVDGLVSAIETQMARLTSVLNAIQLAMVALTIASAVALLYSAYLFVFNPLAQLQAGLTRIGGGDFAARVEVSSTDEFGDLSAGFNQMAQTLQGLYQNLEAKVREKTERLEEQHQRLATLYEAAAFVARARSLEELGNGFARQLRTVAHADAVAIRWSDEGNRHYLMLASDGLPAEIVQEEACLRTHECLCGQASAEAATRVIPIHAVSPNPMLGHCSRAGFRTVAGVPVQLQDRLVGEINLFYRQNAALAPDERALLETLAAHLAGAIEAFRLAALERESAVAQERSLLASELHDSIAQSLSFLKLQVGRLHGALQRGDRPQLEATLAEVEAGVQESLADVRELLLHFRTRTNNEDIAQALRATLHKFELQTGLTTHLSLEGQGLPLGSDVQIQVLHIVQEALSNVRKHAQAREVWVEVERAPQWRFEIRDDGQGFDAEDNPADDTHVGLRIMRERAARIGAQVEVVSVPGSGTAIVLSLPEKSAAPATTT